MSFDVCVGVVPVNGIVSWGIGAAVADWYGAACTLLSWVFVGAVDCALRPGFARVVVAAVRDVVGVADGFRSVRLDMVFQTLKIQEGYRVH